MSLSVLSVPTASGEIEQLVESHWIVLEKTTSKEMIAFARSIGQLPGFAKYSDEQIWQTVEARRLGAGQAQPAEDIKEPVLVETVQTAELAFFKTAGTP